MISIAEIGHFALILALGVALYQFVVPLWGAQRGDVAAMRAGISAALLQLVQESVMEADALFGPAFRKQTRKPIVSVRFTPIQHDMHSSSPPAPSRRRARL